MTSTVTSLEGVGGETRDATTPEGVAQISANSIKMNIINEKVIILSFGNF